MTLIQHLESHYGTYIPVKGMNDISNSLYRLAERKGVKFEFESEVEKIEIQNNQATGIIVNNKLKRFIKWRPKFNNLNTIVKSCISWEKRQ